LAAASVVARAGSAVLGAACRAGALRCRNGSLSSRFMSSVFTFRAGRATAARRALPNVFAVVVVALCSLQCRASTSPVRSGVESTAPADFPYPAAWPRLDAARLVALKAEYETRTPGWELTLDGFGLLDQATCVRCGESPLGQSGLTVDDIERLKRFLAAQSDIVGYDAYGSDMSVPTERILVLRQRTRAGAAGRVTGYRQAGRLRISGHLWPNLPVPREPLGKSQLSALLRARDASEDTTLVYRYEMVVHDEKGLMELREAACLYSPADWMIPGQTGKRPCVDARTGEYLSPRIEGVSGN
jgi:hypothetical protein